MSSGDPCCLGIANKKLWCGDAGMDVFSFGIFKLLWVWVWTSSSILKKSS